MKRYEMKREEGITRQEQATRNGPALAPSSPLAVVLPRLAPQAHREQQSDTKRIMGNVDERRRLCPTDCPVGYLVVNRSGGRDMLVNVGHVISCVHMRATCGSGMFRR